MNVYPNGYQFLIQNWRGLFFCIVDLMLYKVAALFPTLQSLHPKK